MNTPHYFEIQASNPAALASFYNAVFGWKVAKDENLPIEYWRVTTESIAGGILQRPAASQPTHMGTNAYTTSMMVADFDTTAKVIIDNGGQVAMEKFAVPGVCWQGYFLDPDNNVFGLFQADDGAK